MVGSTVKQPSSGMTGSNGPINPPMDFIHEELEDFFEVEIPDILENKIEDEDDWFKIKGWYNELNFYSKVFQFFGEIIKETESMYGWWIILISSFGSFMTLFTIEPLEFTEEQHTFYGWGQSILLSLLSISTTLIASWVKKKAYVKRIQDIDKRINRLEKFLGKLDYQCRLVPITRRVDYFKFITTMRAEYNELSIYTNLISPSEFTYTVYIITRYNTPIIRGTWPWYDTITKQPRREFARHIIDTYK